jgi:transmembrane 9 superfamily protein 3
VAAADEYDHKYTIGDPINLWVNKVGPYNNPQETYNYYELPFCKPKNSEAKVHKWGGLGEVLQGNELIHSDMEFKFRMDQPKRTMCTFKLDAKRVREFSFAVKNHYWYEMFLDDLPLWGFVGERVVPDEDEAESAGEEDTDLFLYTHRTYDLSFNGDKVIMVNLTSESPVPLTEGADIEMTYSVTWSPTDVKYGHRYNRYLDYNFFEHQIHWFSIFNSFMMVIFLVGLVAMILMRTLHRDYAKYTRDEDDVESLERDMDESGWKLCHGDVFRPPRALEIMAAVVGTGAQLAFLAVFTVLIAIAGSLFNGRGTILTVFIVCYALTSFVSGYVSGGLYARNDGKAWIPTMLLTASLFPVSTFAVAFVLNTIAIFYHSLAAIPFGSIVVVLFMWGFISFPLTLLGTVVGRNWNGVPDNPCRIKTIPRTIPEREWYLTPTVIALAGGLLPFGSIFIELYFVLTSFWNYKVYFVYGFMLLVFIILAIVTACVSVVGTYFLLNAENYHWQWTSLLSSASTAVYVYLYSTYYFVFKTKMTGLFQCSFYFGYTAIACLAVALTCGAIGYSASSLFTHRIYRAIKCD